MSMLNRFRYLPLSLLFSTLCPLPATAAEPLVELNTAMMRSTFKLDGDGSIGTSFILCHPDTTSTGCHFVLITADHVLTMMKGEKATLHLRRKTPSSYEKLPVEITIRTNGVPTWTKHPQADVAAMAVTIPPDADIGLLSTSLLADDSYYNELDIHPGDKLFALGFPFGAESDDSGFPILRSGAIASFPLTPTKQTKNFLFDFQVFRGNSGGPVYIYERNRLVKDKLPMTFDLSIIMGLVSQERNVTETVQSLYEKRDLVHPLNVAIVVHASLIHETVEMLFSGKPPPTSQPPPAEKH